MTERTQIWNCGGGVQSTAIAILIIQGVLQKPDLAVIADTERERSSTWRYLDRHTIPALREIGVELHRIPKSKYATVDLWGGQDGNTLLIPAFTDNSGEAGKLPGFCAKEWKGRVVDRWATQEHGVKAADHWIGFSTDERRRARSYGAGKWMRRFPLIELGKNRDDCYGLIHRHGWPQPSRSSCWQCPNHNETEWEEIRRDDPGDFAQAVTLDHGIRATDPTVYLHNTCQPLDSVDFDAKQDVMFGGCDSGMCFT